MTVADTSQLIEAFEHATEAHAIAVGVELDLEAEKAEAKQSAVRRLLGATNPLTGKPHSATSAEAVAEMDEEYRAFLRRRREAVVAKNRLEGQKEAARLRALLALVLARKG